MSKPVFYPRSVERRLVEALNEALDQSPASAQVRATLRWRERPVAFALGALADEIDVRRCQPA